MNKAQLEARKRLMDEKAKDPNYMISSYEKQRIKRLAYTDDRKRI